MTGRDLQISAVVSRCCLRFTAPFEGLSQIELGTGLRRIGVQGTLPVINGDFFAAMAAAYVEHEPPASSILMLYGAGLAGFIAGFEPAANLPYLADVAWLEWLIHEAANAADAASIGSAELAAVPIESVANLRLRPRTVTERR